MGPDGILPDETGINGSTKNTKNKEGKSSKKKNVAIDGNVATCCCFINTWLPQLQSVQKTIMLVTHSLPHTTTGSGPIAPHVPIPPHPL